MATAVNGSFSLPFGSRQSVKQSSVLQFEGRASVKSTRPLPTELRAGVKSVHPLPWMNIGYTPVSRIIGLPLANRSYVNRNVALPFANGANIKGFATAVFAHRMSVTHATPLPLQHFSFIARKVRAAFSNGSNIKGYATAVFEHRVNLIATKQLPLESVLLYNITRNIALPYQWKETVGGSHVLPFQHIINPITANPVLVVTVPAVSRVIGAVMGAASSDFPPCDAGDQDIYSFDFTSRLQSGETLLGAGIWSINVITGNDPNPNSHILAGPTLTGNVTTCMLGGFLASRKYQIIVQQTTSLGRIAFAYSHVTCNPVVGQ